MASVMRGLSACALTFLFAAGFSAVSGERASAASAAVEMACMSDYFAYCSKYDPDSSAGRNCMSTHGNELSKRCINALVKAGEVTKAEIDRRSSRGR